MSHEIFFGSIDLTPYFQRRDGFTFVFMRLPKALLEAVNSYRQGPHTITTFINGEIFERAVRFEIPPNPIHFTLTEKRSRFGIYHFIFLKSDNDYATYLLALERCTK